jgi:hypothetical protein
MMTKKASVKKATKKAVAKKATEKPSRKSRRLLRPYQRLLWKTPRTLSRLRRPRR